MSQNKPVVETVLIRMLDKLENMDEQLANVDKRLAVYNEQLLQHMKRTDIAEAQLREFAESLNTYKEDRAKLSALMWVGGILGSVTAFFVVLKELFTK
jgi:wyosine [tRNA(Phe)-imidazoG37] synthetase (radical SAM superfamily)